MQWLWRTRMRRWFCGLLAPVLLLALVQHATASAPASKAAPSPSSVPAAAVAAVDQLMPLAGGALVHAGQRDWEAAAMELAQYAAAWQAQGASPSAEAAAVGAALAEAQKALAGAAAKPEAAYAAFSQLTKATDAFVQAQAPGGAPKGDGRAAAKALLPALEQSLAALKQQQPDKARSEYRRFDGQWAKAENQVRADNPQAYGEIETKLSLARIPLQAEPPRTEAAAQGIAELIRAIDDYASGRAAAQGADAGAEQPTVEGALALLKQTADGAAAARYDEAAERMQAFIRLWPSVEGTVQTRSPEVYARIENQMTEAAGYLLSAPPKGEAAARVIAAMQAALEPFRGASGYTAWDAALILLREGLEALLVLAALLAYVQRSGQAALRRWVWGGAAAGLLASVALAAVLTATIAGLAAGSARELIEGVTGLVSVALMLTVGAWLHGKAQARSWSSYVGEQLGAALQTGRLWSLFAVAALAILREGAETTIFYAGMAASIEPAQLALGIGGALVALAALGVAMVKGSVRLPVRPFFLTATVLIYYLVFKFVGQSVHALQVAGELPAHTSVWLPSWSWLGVYPTWETTAPQLAALVWIAMQFVRTERRKRASDTDAGASGADAARS